MEFITQNPMIIAAFVIAMLIAGGVVYYVFKQKFEEEFEILSKDYSNLDMQKRRLDTEVEILRRNSKADKDLIEQMTVDSKLLEVKIEELRNIISANAESFDEQIKQARYRGVMADYALNAISKHAEEKHEIVKLVVQYVRDTIAGKFELEPPFDTVVPDSIQTLILEIERSLRKRPGRG